MTTDLAVLTRTPCIGCLDEPHRAMIVTMRWWVSLRKRGCNPSTAIAERLGSEEAVVRFWLFMEAVGAAWPDPFIVSPPCCGRLSFDEATLVQMLGHIGRGDRCGLYRLLGEMLPIEQSERLYVATAALLDAVAQPAD